MNKIQPRFWMAQLFKQLPHPPKAGPNSGGTDPL
jgi:hypothetical protein